MLSELRKYRMALILTHQYLSQVDPLIRDAILGNAGTMIAFRLGVTDAEILEKEFYPEFSMRDLINLPTYSIYLKLRLMVWCPPRLARRRGCRQTRDGHPSKNLQFKAQLSQC